MQNKLCRPEKNLNFNHQSNVHYSQKLGPSLSRNEPLDLSSWAREQYTYISCINPEYHVIFSIQATEITPLSSRGVISVACIYVYISRVLDQNGVSQAWYIVEIHHSARKPSIYMYVCMYIFLTDAKMPTFHLDWKPQWQWHQSASVMSWYSEWWRVHERRPAVGIQCPALALHSSTHQGWLSSLDCHGSPHHWRRRSMV